MITNAMSVDVEDYYQVSAFESIAPRSKWQEFPSRVEQSTNRVLDLFQDKNIKSTFFTLGVVAKQYPALIRRIVDDGHEVASHGMYHQRVTEMSRENFKADISESKKLLEDLSGCEVIGYRAPSYSISKSNLWAHEELLEADYRYSSSVYPVKHDLYGIPDAPRFAYRPEYASELLEIPITTLPVLNRNIPIGGGGYFRLFPYALYRRFVQKFNEKEGQPTLFYFHPWEIDPDQPRPKGLPMKSRFRHYLNLEKTEGRLAKLITDFQWNTMATVFKEAIS